MDKLRQHAGDLLGYLERSEAALVHYIARRRLSEPIATSFVESAVDEIAADALEQGHVPAFLEVPVAVLNDTFEDAFR